MSFISDRHKAFVSVIDSDDTAELKRYCQKYGMLMPRSKKVMIAGALKAIQFCTDFSEEEKTKAMQKCLKMGFNPLIRPVEGGTE